LEWGPPCARNCHCREHAQGVGGLRRAGLRKLSRRASQWLRPNHSVRHGESSQWRICEAASRMSPVGAAVPSSRVAAASRMSADTEDQSPGGGSASALILRCPIRAGAGEAAAGTDDGPRRPASRPVGRYMPARKGWRVRFLGQRPTDCELIMVLTFDTSNDMLSLLGGNSLKVLTNAAMPLPACPRIQLRFSAHSS
jgi:hypothetical protein